MVDYILLDIEAATLVSTCVVHEKDNLNTSDI